MPWRDRSPAAWGPDVLPLQRPNIGNGARSPPATGTIATLAPPATTFMFSAEVNEYTARQRSLLIRHTSNHRIVALIEIVSAGNKASDYAFEQFLVKVGGALHHGIHLLILDLQPPTDRDPHGIHTAVWENIRAGTWNPPADQPFTLASYEAGVKPKAYVEALRVGQALPDMPVFLAPGWHVMAPLESTYLGAWEGVPEFIQVLLTHEPSVA